MRSTLLSLPIDWRSYGLKFFSFAQMYDRAGSLSHLSSIIQAFPGKCNCWLQYVIFRSDVDNFNFLPKPGAISLFKISSYACLEMASSTYSPISAYATTKRKAFNKNSKILAAVHLADLHRSVIQIASMI